MAKTVKVKNNDWTGKYAEWIEGKVAYLSVVFSWDMQKAHMRASALRQQGYTVYAGGPAVMMQPHILADLAQINGLPVDAIQRHNPNATYTSRGCINNCEYCIVPKVEGDLIELNHWNYGNIICDNNLLACSRQHFDKVIDSLKGIEGVDFNQGLDARCLTPYHASRITELKLRCVRLAWDHIEQEQNIQDAFDCLLAAGLPKSMIRVYILIGYDDSPDNALYRLETVRKLGGVTSPMRYQPLRAKKRDRHVEKPWVDRELKRFMRYWSNLAHLGAIPFREYR